MYLGRLGGKTSEYCNRPGTLNPKGGKPEALYICCSTGGGGKAIERDATDKAIQAFVEQVNYIK